MAQGKKTEKFSGINFKRSQLKILFYLTTLSLTRFLKKDPPTISENDVNPNKSATLDAWNQSDLLYRNYICNGLDRALYSLYFQVKTVKKLWRCLRKKIQGRGCKAKEVHC